MNIRRWAILALAAVGLCSSLAHAGVYLTSYTFPTNNLPYIWTDEVLPPPYKLRAKIQPNYHATDGWNNQNTQLWSVPGTSYFTVELYWVKYASDYSTILEIGPKNIQTIYVQPAGNTAPTIQWTSNPSVVQENQSYLIQAMGSDSNGNLTQVNIWKQWTPFAFAGGGNGWNGYSGNWTSDTGGQSIQFEAQAVDSAGATSSFIYHSVFVNRKPTIWWEVVPSSTVAYGTSYTIRARAQDADGNMTTVNIYRNEVPFAFELNGNGSYASSENPDQAYFYGTVTYRAEAIDSTGISSGSIYYTVYVPNNQPIAGWSSNNPGTSVMPSGAPRIDTYIGQNYTFMVSGMDPDGNLSRVETFEYAWEDVSGTYLIRQNYQQFDTIYSAGGGPISKSYTHTGGKPWKWNYQYVALAYDSAGTFDSPVGDNVLFVNLDNRSPAPPTLVSNQTSMTVGQSVTLSAAGTDQDGNATLQVLWYRGPDQGPNEWITLSSSSYAAGTGNTTVNFTFTPTKVGAYYFKTRVDDPYVGQQIVDVAPLSVLADTTPPNAPTNLVVNGITPTWAVLGWTLSTSNDVGEQHVYWQAITGGSTTDILLGSNVAGVSVTGLSPGISYRMYLKARDTSGNYSTSSNEVTVSTPVPVTIVSSPQSVNANPGQTVTFTVAATGSPPLTYQWLKNGGILTNGGIVSGATSNTLTLVGVQAGNAGNYSVVVSNTAGSVLSGTAVLTMNAPPSIITHPASQSANPGQSVTFSVSAAGTAPLTYQWRKNGASINGATNSNYTIASVQASDAANAPGYSVVVANALGSIASNSATLSVTTTQPVRLALQYWQPYDYPNYSSGGHWEDQWVYYDGQWVEDGYWEDEYDNPDDPGQVTGQHWVSTGSHWEDAHWGWESVWVDDFYPDGQYGSRWNTTVGLFDNPLYSASSAYRPSSTNRGYLLYSYPGWYVIFRAWAYAPSGNCNSFSYSVYSPGGSFTGYSGSIPNGSYAEVWFPIWAWGTGGYRVDLSYSGATQTSNPGGTVSYYIAYGVPLPPTITAHPIPESQTVNAGATVAYSVTATGASSYQWRKDGAAISGGTGTLLTLSTVQTSATGSYDVVVSNGSGSTTSNTAALLVTNEPFADSDGDGIPNGIEQLLLTDPQNAGSSDATNASLKLKINKP